MRLRRVSGWVACIFAIFAGEVGATEKTADVTVLLFQTEAVQQVRVKAASALLRLCAACEGKQGPVLLDLRARGGGMQDRTGKPLRTVQVDGEVEVTTAGGRRALAAGLWTVDAGRGGLRVRVVVPRERYVAAVLGAEASPGEPVESLKAMAVVVRSFGAAAGARHEGGALCDSTHCQALRFGAVSDPVRHAVWETSGETLWFGVRRVAGYFSQNCAGFTADAAETWGGAERPWLTAHTDAWCARVPSQWHASVSAAEVRSALDAEGYSLREDVRELSVASRDRSGRARQVRVSTQGETRVLPAAALRFALDRGLGWNQLRSDRYQVRRVGDRFVFEGNGHGHGVGLCQAGAAEMARAGRHYREILREYFPRAEVRLNAADAGWSNVPKAGFAMRLTRRDAVLEAEAARAFAEAKSLWGVAAPVGLTLSVFPTTEDFRQATGQPGWDLAVSRGSRIATQPMAILRAHGGATGILRHEFLHGFVEASASPAAPVWLREGLVEVLNGEACPGHNAAKGTEVDALLLHAGSLEEARRAHEQACSLVRLQLAERGMGAVRAMLTGGAAR